MNIIIIIIFFILETSIAFSQTVEFKKLVKAFPNSAIVSISNSSVTIKNIVYQKNKNSFPILLPDGLKNFKGDYIIFLNDVEKTTMLDSYAFRIQDNFVTLSEPKKLPQVIDTTEDLSTKRVEISVKRRIWLPDLIEILKGYNK